MSIIDLPGFSLPKDITVDPGRFKHAMRQLAGAVSVITVGQGEERTGFTATSVCSFSIEPPSILVCLDRSSSSWPVLQRAGRFAVNMLAHDQQAIADRFAGRGRLQGADRYEGATWTELVTGTAVLGDALAVLDCELDEAIERHSHAILTGRVRAITVRGEAQPLLYWQGSYHNLTGLAVR